jgi:hypothetical protein
MHPSEPFSPSNPATPTAAGTRTAAAASSRAAIIPRRILTSRFNLRISPHIRAISAVEHLVHVINRSHAAAVDHIPWP